MGRGSSKAGGGGSAVAMGGAPNTANSADTVERRVEAINAHAVKEGTRAMIRDEFDGMPTGAVVSIYTPDRVGTGGLEMEGIIDDGSLRSYKKTADGTWVQVKSDGTLGLAAYGKTSGDLMRDVYNNPRKVAAGVPDTSSHVKVTGRAGKPVDGLRYASGTYDIARTERMDGPSGRRIAAKVETQGKLTTYNGTQYGVQKSGGSYKITHVPTGMLIGSGTVKSMSGVSSAIKAFSDSMSPTLQKSIEAAEKRFKNTIRAK